MLEEKRAHVPGRAGNPLVAADCRAANGGQRHSRSIRRILHLAPHPDMGPHSTRQPTLSGKGNANGIVSKRPAAGIVLNTGTGAISCTRNGGSDRSGKRGSHDRVVPPEPDPAAVSARRRVSHATAAPLPGGNLLPVGPAAHEATVTLSGCVRPAPGRWRRERRYSSCSGGLLQATGSRAPSSKPEKRSLPSVDPAREHSGAQARILPA